MRPTTATALTLSATIALATLAGGPPPARAAEPAPQQKVPPIIQHSEWDMAIFHAGVVKQDAYLRIDNGVIYAWQSNAPAGRAAIGPDGKLRIAFLGHRKVGNGEAVLVRKGNGHWEGQLAFPASVAGIRLKKK